MNNAPRLLWFLAILLLVTSTGGYAKQTQDSKQEQGTSGDDRQSSGTDSSEEDDEEFDEDTDGLDTDTTEDFFDDFFEE